MKTVFLSRALHVSLCELLEHISVWDDPSDAQRAAQ